MKTGAWLWQGQTGQLNLRFLKNSLDPKYEDLIFISDRSENLYQKILYKNYYVLEDFLNHFKINIGSVNNYLHRALNLEKAPSISSILFDPHLSPAGDQFILQLLLIKTLREYIGISGTLILEDGLLSVLDIKYRHLAIEILSSISEQVIIFEGSWWSDFPQQFNLTNLNLIHLQGKSSPNIT